MASFFEPAVLAAFVIAAQLALLPALVGARFLLTFDLPSFARLAEESDAWLNLFARRLLFVTLRLQEPAPDALAAVADKTKVLSKVAYRLGKYGMDLIRGFFLSGPGPVAGVIFCCRNMRALAASGSVKNGSGADRSSHHRMKGEWNSSMFVASDA